MSDPDTIGICAGPCDHNDCKEYWRVRSALPPVSPPELELLRERLIRSLLSEVRTPDSGTIMARERAEADVREFESAVRAALRAGPPQVCSLSGEPYETCDEKMGGCCGAPTQISHEEWEAATAELFEAIGEGYGITRDRCKGLAFRVLTAAKRGRAGPPPTGRSLLGIAPDLTGGVESTEYVRRLRATSEPSLTPEELAAVIAFGEYGYTRGNHTDNGYPGPVPGPLTPHVYAMQSAVNKLRAIDGRGTATP